MTKYYEVIGSAPVVLDGRSVAPGVTTTAEIEPDLEAFLLRLGAIRIVDPRTEVGAILPKDPRPESHTHPKRSNPTGQRGKAAVAEEEE